MVALEMCLLADLAHRRLDVRAGESFREAGELVHVGVVDLGLQVAAEVDPHDVGALLRRGQIYALIGGGVAALVVVALGVVLLTGGDSTEAVEAGAPVTGSTDSTAPTGTMRAHWEAIAGGDYPSAYGQLASDFRDDSSLEEWAADLRSKAPSVNLIRVQYLRALDSENAEIAGEVVSRNADQQECLRRDSRVRVVKENGMALLAGSPGRHVHPPRESSGNQCTLCTAAVMAVFCTSCGAALGDADDFCCECGAEGRHPSRSPARSAARRRVRVSRSATPVSHPPIGRGRW